MAHPLLIALVGIDGAGKTSHAAALATWLTACGVPTIVRKNPGGRLALGRLARRLGRTDALTLLGRAFAPIEALLRGLAIMLTLLLARLTGRAVVMDRYTYCQYAAMTARGDRGVRLVRAAYALFPRPDLTCLLAVDPARAQRRVQRRGTDREDLSYLQALDAAYRRLPEARSFTVVDANGSLGEVRDALAHAVVTRLGVRPAAPI